MLSYTKATLKAALTSWNRNGSPEFVLELDNIIKRGEVQLIRALDLDCQVGETDTTTAALTSEVFKPEDLIAETELWITVAGVRTMLLKRSRAWVRLMGTTAGTPLYFCELDEFRWTVGPPALAAYLIDVTGELAPESITDGDDNNTTWMSTKVPDLLYLSCAIMACEFLKFWTHKAAALEEFAAAVAIYRGETPNQTLTQAGDQLGSRQEANPAKGPGA